MKKIIEITDLKDMLKKTGELYDDKPAYKLKTSVKGEYKIITHKEVRQQVNALGTALINMGLKGKRIAVIGENRYEWEVDYLSVACGTGIIVPFDKALPVNELKSLIERSKVEAIFFSGKYAEMMEKIREEKIGNINYFISMDLKKADDKFLSHYELIEEGVKLLESGDRRFLDAEIDPNIMNIMLFTSGTTDKSKVVALSHNNISSNLMDITRVINLDYNDVILSFLPLHHIFECTVGFLLALYTGATVCFSEGPRAMIENLNEYKITFMSSVPALYEMIYYKYILKRLEKEEKLDKFKEDLIKYADCTMEEKKEAFKYIHEMLGGKLRYLFSGAAALDPNVEKAYRALGFNMLQGYGLTETSPVIGVETDELNKVGSVGKCLPSLEVKLVDVDDEGMGELAVRGPNVMLGYFENEEATKEVMDEDGWFRTGDLAKIDEEGYIFICGRKKSVIVLQNGKNIFPEEMENILNKIEGVNESFIFGKVSSENNEEAVKIFAKIVFDRSVMNKTYNAVTDDEIYNVLNSKIKEVNKSMPAYKSIRGLIITETPLIKTTTGKTKRQEEMKTL